MVFKYTKIMVVTNQNVINGGVRDVISEHTIKGDVITGEIRKERTNMELIDEVLGKHKALTVMLGPKEV